MELKQNRDQPSTCEREQKRKTMLEEALSRPGVREAMKVYEQWQRQDQGLDPYRAATKERSQIITTDHANTR